MAKNKTCNGRYLAVVLADGLNVSPGEIAEVLRNIEELGAQAKQLEAGVLDIAIKIEGSEKQVKEAVEIIKSRFKNVSTRGSLPICEEVGRVFC